MKARVEYSTVDQHKEYFESEDEAFAHALWVIKSEPVGTNVAIYRMDGKVVTIFTTQPYA